MASQDKELKFLVDLTINLLINLLESDLYLGM